MIGEGQRRGGEETPPYDDLDGAGFGRDEKTPARVCGRSFEQVERAALRAGLDGGITLATSRNHVTREVPDAERDLAAGPEESQVYRQELADRGEPAVR